MSYLTSSSAQRLYLCSRSRCQLRWQPGRLRLKNSKASQSGEITPDKITKINKESSKSTKANPTYSLNEQARPPSSRLEHPINAPVKRSKGPLLWGSVAIGSVLVSGGLLVVAAKLSPDFRSTAEEKLGWTKSLFQLTIGEGKKEAEGKGDLQSRQIAEWEKKLYKEDVTESSATTTTAPSESPVKKKKKNKKRTPKSTSEDTSGDLPSESVADVRRAETAAALATLQTNHGQGKQKQDDAVTKHLPDLEGKPSAEHLAVDQEHWLQALAAKQRKQEQAARQEALSSANAACQHLFDVVEDAVEASQSLTKHSKAYALQLLEVIKLRAAKDAAAETAKVQGSHQEQVVSELSSKVRQCDSAMEQATVALDQALVHAIGLGELDGATAISQKASDAITRLHHVAEEAAEAQADLNVIEHYCQQVEQRYQTHQNELKHLAHTQADLKDKVAGKGGSEESAGSLYDAAVQSLLAFAQRRVERMQESIESRQKHEAQSVAALLEEQRREDARVMELKLDHLRHQLQREHNDQLQQNALEAQLRIEDEVCKQVQRQTAAHTEHLKSSLAEHADRLNARWQEQLETELAEQGLRHTKEVATISAKLQDAESVVLRSAETLKTGQDAHILWDECRSLQSSLRGPSQRTESMEARVARMRALSPEGSMVKTVLDSIPSRALSSGAATEHALCQRFKRVKTSCSRVALIGEKGGGMFDYFLSFVQSLLIMPYRRWQLSVEDIQLSNLDTYNILELASKRIENGQLEQGVRLMNQLQGQPRQLAQDWLDEARIFLETRQALNLLMAEAVLISSAKLS